MSTKFVVLFAQVFVSLAAASSAPAQDATTAASVPAVDPLTSTQPAAQPHRWGGPRGPGQRPMDDQHICAFTLGTLASRGPGADAIVSHDGSSITISARPQRPGSTASPRALEVRVYTANGMSSVSGLACNFDRKKTVGDGAAEILLRAMERQDHKESHPPVPMPPPNQMEAGQPGPHGPGEFREHRREELARAVESCAKVYPQVEALRASGAFKDALTDVVAAPASPVPTAPAASITQ